MIRQQFTVTGIKHNILRNALYAIDDTLIVCVAFNVNGFLRRKLTISTALVISEIHIEHVCESYACHVVTKSQCSLM